MVWSENQVDLVGGAFWTMVDSDPFTRKDFVHPMAVPPGDEQPWGAGDYEWGELAWVEPGIYRVVFSANPGELAPFGNYIPADGAERTCWVEVEVTAGAVAEVVISDIPRGNKVCPNA